MEVENQQQEVLPVQNSRTALTIATISLEDLNKKGYSIKELHEEVSREVTALKFLGTVLLDNKCNVTSLSKEAKSFGLVFKYENDALASKLQQIIRDADFEVEIINTY
jgi:hypothetical protein